MEEEGEETVISSPSSLVDQVAGARLPSPTAEGCCAFFFCLSRCLLASFLASSCSLWTSRHRLSSDHEASYIAPKRQSAVLSRAIAFILVLAWMTLTLAVAGILFPKPPRTWSTLSRAKYSETFA